jgi:hypothetical protein
MDPKVYATVMEDQPSVPGIYAPQFSPVLFYFLASFFVLWISAILTVSVIHLIKTRVKISHEKRLSEQKARNLDSQVVKALPE